MNDGSSKYRLLSVCTALLLLLNSFGGYFAGGAAAAAPEISAAVEVSADPVAAGSAAAINVNLLSAEAAALLVDVEIFDASLRKVHQVFIDNISVEEGQPKTVPFSWHIPADSPAGAYVISIGLFGAGWSGMYAWQAGAATLQVAAGTPTLSFTSAAAASPSQALPGSLVHIDAAVTASLAASGLVQVSVIAPDGSTAYSESYNESFQAGQSRQLSLDWSVPTEAAQGAYKIAVTVTSAEGVQQHANANAGAFTVTASPQQSLDTPDGLAAIPGEGQIALSWNEVASAAGYELEIDGTQLAAVENAAYTHSGLAAGAAHTYRVRATNADVFSEWSQTVSASALPSSTAGGKLQVKVKTGTNAAAQMPTPELEIFNIGSEPVSLDAIKARYYFTIDGEKPLAIGFWSTAPKELVNARFVKMPVPSAQADHYLEISFGPGAGWLQPNAKAGVYTWINKTDWSSFNQSDDYSYSASASSEINTKATAYLADVLDWGAEPELLDLPAAPTELAGTPSDESIVLAWEAVEGADSYELKADGTTIEAVTGTEYVHQWLRPGTRHVYQIRTKKGTAYSIWSAPVTIKTTGQQQLPAPVNVRGATAETSISLFWKALEEEITGYELEADGAIIDVGMAISYVHSGLTAGTAHTYRVRAKDGATAGSWSKPLTTNTVLAPTGAFEVQFQVDPAAERAPISPYIYGTNDDLSGTENWGARRLGGNRLSTYNWENNASNAGDDYFHNSDNYIPWYYGGVPWGGNMDEPAIGVAGFHQQSLAKGAYTLATLQTAGFVAKDKNGPVSEAETAPSSRWVPVKAAKNAPFSLNPDVNDNAVYMDEFVNALVHRFGSAATPTGIKGYSIDNEPSLWQKTHPYMHPEKPGSEEVLTKGIELAKAVKQVDPAAEMFGPAAYSFDELYSMHAADDWNSIKGNYAWYVDYYLDKFRMASAQENKRLLDALDFHWYPEISAGGQRITDASSYSNLEANLARMQAPRSLWDPTYTENSWIGQWYSSFLPILPRVQQSIDAYNPGTKIAITEYNYGGEDNVYGGIAQADVLGIFGKYGVHLATFWKMVNHLEEAPYISAAVKLFTNYDGQNGKYGDTKVKAETANIENSSIYASVAQGSGDALHLIVLNKNNDYPMNAVLNIAGAESYTSASVFGFDESGSEITERQSITGIVDNTFTYTVPKLTALHIVLSK